MMHPTMSRPAIEGSASGQFDQWPRPWARAPRVVARLTSCSTGMTEPGRNVNIPAQIAASGATTFSSSTCGRC